MDVPGTLIDDHLNGELSTPGFVELEEWLRQRNSHVREFAIQWLIHSSLLDLLSQWEFHADALLRAMRTNGDSAAATLSNRADGCRPTTEPTALGTMDGGPTKARAGSWRIALAGLAALLLVATTVGAWRYLAARPRVVAMLTQTANCQWDPAGRSLVDGALLKTGDVLRLTEGRAAVSFSSGARTVLDAPAVLTIQSEMMATLTMGTATTTVPTQAVGFTMNMPRGKLVDLGTQFTLRIRPDDSFEVQVFEGLVELHQIDQNHPVDESPLRISRGVAIKVAAGSREAQSIPYDANQNIIMP